MSALLLRRLAALAAVVVVSSLLATPGAQATPRFAARNNAPCMLCHVNPSGGGMRTTYGRTIYARQRLPAPWLAGTFGEQAGVFADPRIGQNMALGGDLRAAYLRTSPAQGPPTLDSFLLMQADLYATLEVSSHTTIYLDYGAWGSFETFALFHFGMREPAGAATSGDVAPQQAPTWSGYVKIGRFVPTFGLKLPSHQTFTREGQGFTATKRETGVEAGIYAGPFLLQTSWVRGTLTDGALAGTTYNRFEYLRQGNLVKLALGGSLSYSRRVANQNPALSPDIDLNAGINTDWGFYELRVAGHATVSVGRFTYLAEVTHIRNRSLQTDRVGRALVSYQELAFLPRQGLDLQLLYEYADADFDLAAGNIHRVGASVELYPWDGTELAAIYRYTVAPAGNLLDKAQDLMLFAHVFF